MSLKLSYLYDHTTEEIGIALNLSTNTVHKRISRAKSYFKVILTKEGVFTVKISDKDFDKPLVSQYRKFLMTITSNSKPMKNYVPKVALLMNSSPALKSK